MRDFDGEFEVSENMERGTLPGCCFPLRLLLFALDWSLGYLLVWCGVGGRRDGVVAMAWSQYIASPVRRTATRTLVEVQGSRARSPSHARSLILTDARV